MEKSPPWEPNPVSVEDIDNETSYDILDFELSLISIKIDNKSIKYILVYVRQLLKTIATCVP